MEFADFLEEAAISPNVYLRTAKENAKRYGLKYRTLQWSTAKHKKLCIRDEDNRLVHFGSASNGDFIVWSILERRGEVPPGYARMKRNVFWTSHTAMHYDRKNPYSPNNLALHILW